MLHEWEGRGRGAWIHLRRVSSLETTSLHYAERGNPADVVHLKKEQLTVDLKPGQVLVKFLASPVNPADINTIQANMRYLSFTLSVRR